jgi:hypothetical protein
MIDFPNSPADQAIFNGPNGVIYQWIAASNLWKALGVGQQSIVVGDTAPASPFNGMMWWNSTLAQLFIYYNDGNSSQWVPAVPPATQLLTTPGGDFFAYHSAPPSLGTALTQMIPNTIYSGNSGNWYNPSNGRYTPPPGRYLLMAGYVSYAGSATTAQLWLRKNGVNLGGAGSTLLGIGMQVPAGASWQGDPQGTAIVDANGTDYFDYVVQNNAASTVLSEWFGAFPISGVQGPAGPPGVVGTTWRQLQRTVISAAQPSFDITGIPADINELMFTYDLTPVTASGLVFQFYNNTGTLDATGPYGWVGKWANNAMAGGAAVVTYSGNSQGFTTGVVFNGSVAGWGVSTTSGGRGRGQVVNIRDTTRGKNVDFACSWVDQTNSYLGTFDGQGWRGTVGAITGLRLSFGTGNIASGAVEVWGSP